ncbi:MAG TPA: DUF1508 domain-containing protein [Gemmataceae bacterium]|jgi:uncharacterized protein YegP (UPF0339 family)|nr:DUF1508 domain-containing protein [Gemmataceae bacterium]
MLSTKWLGVTAFGLFAVACTLTSGRVQARQAGGNLKFEMFQDKAKEYRWRLKAANGEILGSSGQGYKAKADCKNGVERIKKDAEKLKFEVYQDNKGEYRWRVIATNGQTIGSSSEGYKAKADCEKAVDTVKKGAAKAEVDDKT